MQKIIIFLIVIAMVFPIIGNENCEVEIKKVDNARAAGVIFNILFTIWAIFTYHEIIRNE